jgi:hypothetical protein
MRKIFPPQDLGNLVRPKVRQLALEIMLNDPSFKLLLTNGLNVKVLSRAGTTLDAFAKLKDGVLSLNVKAMPKGFEYKQSVLIAFITNPVITSQVIIKEAIGNTLILQSASTRFHERRHIESPCTVYKVPQAVTAKILTGELVLERNSFFSTEKGLTTIWNDRLVYRGTQNSAPFFDIKTQTNGEIVTLSKGGLGIRRIHVNEPTPMLIYLQTTLRWGKTRIQIRCFAAVRQSTVKDGLETLHCCFLDELPKLPTEISSGAASVNLSFADQSLVYVNGDVKAHAREVNLMLPFGTHILKVENSKGEERQSVLKVSSNTPSEIKFTLP